MTEQPSQPTGAGAEGRDVEAADVTEQDRATAADIVQYMRPVYQREDYMTAIAAAIAKARAEVAAGGVLRFAGLVLKEHREFMGDVDGGSIQDWAVECGLLEGRETTAEQVPCGEDCCCEAGDTCYFATEIGRMALSAARPASPPTREEE